MKLNRTDVERLNALIDKNPTLKGQLEKLVQLWSLVDSEYVGIKSELDIVEEKLRKVNQERLDLQRCQRQLKNKMQSMLYGDEDLAVDDDDDDDMQCEDKCDSDY
jgi:hypothetical protein